MSFNSKVSDKIRVEKNKAENNGPSQILLKTNNKDNNTSSDKNKKDESTPEETGQQTLEVTLNKQQKTLEKWI